MVKNPVKFGKYYLLERINVGGMAEVFKAKSFGEAGFERLVAVKRILPSIAEDQEFITMFIDEAKLAVQLTHPNIAQIFELGKVGDAYFISLEYVQGKDLRSIFDRARKRGEPIPIPMACYIVMKICEGLDYAHNKKDAAGRNLELVHRDVSPQNMLISYDGDVKLIDFGIAKAASKSSKTQAGILKGKFGYMSPEQVRGLQVDRRSDIFSVGICLYELLTMERLFVGESDFSTLEKVRNVEIMPPSTYNRKVPEELEQIVLKALAKHPEDRYRTAMDLHDDLQSFMYTSGNFFARKDLSTYQHRIFQDELVKEAAKDEEFRKFDSRKASDLDVFDGAAAPPGNSGGGRNAPPPPPAPPRVSAPPPPPSAANAGRKATMMGGMVAPAGPPARMSVPPPAPPPPQRPAPPPPQAAPVVAAAAPVGLDMDWDDEELATQVYDKADGMPYPGPTPGRASANGHAPAPVMMAPAHSPGSFSSPRAQTAPMVAAVSLGAPKSLPPIPAPPPGMSPSKATLMNGAMGMPAVGAPMPQHQQQGHHGMNGMNGMGMPPPGMMQGPMGPGGMQGNPMGGMGGPAARAPRPFRMDGPQTAAAAPYPERKKNANVFIFAGLGVAAVAAAVVIGLGAFSKPATGNLVVSTNVPGVMLSIDGRPQAGDGMSFTVSSLPSTTRHHLVATRPGYRTVEQEVSIREGETTPLQLRLDPEPTMQQTVAMMPGMMAAPQQQMMVPQQPQMVPVQPQPMVPAPAPAPVAVAPAPVAAAPAPALAPAAQPAPQQQERQPRRAGRRSSRSTASNDDPPPSRPTRNTSSGGGGGGGSSGGGGGGGGTGMLSISTRPASRCTVAGQSFSTPRLHLELPAGTHRVSCTNSDYNVSANFTVTVRAGQETREANHPLN